MTVPSSYTPEMRAADFATVRRALRALSDAWIYDRPPTLDEAVLLGSEANIAIARLAVAADVPMPDWLNPRLTQGS